MQNHVVTANSHILKFSSYIQLVKLRLSSLVVFSSMMVYLLANQESLKWVEFILFGLSGLLITGSANTFNQWIEKDLDKLMVRTQERPLPTNKLTRNEAFLFGSALLLIGCTLMKISTNWLTLFLAIVSFILYVFVYTPMKQVSPISVLIGAFPGALPPLIGWAAVKNEISLVSLVLFGIQFIWQFPHFWAIAWVLDDDYKKAGFRMLPGSGERDLNTAFQIMIYTLLLLPLGLLPTHFGLTGINSAIIATVCGTLFLIQTLHHMRNCTRKSALGIMFGSFIYLPVVQLAYVFDKL